MAGKKASKAASTDGVDAAPAGAKSGGVVGLALLAVGALATSFATVYFLTPSAPIAAAPACAPGESATVAESSIKPNQSYVELRDILVTIGSEPATRYIKLKIAIICDSASTSTVTDAEPVLIDAFTNYLRSVELTDFENPGFYSHMRDQLGRRSQLVLGGGVSDGVLITEFLLR
tara:strand:+ start:47863 stop:48387 length:525 start_codon:yes stop_codon:yes gene_type:complete